MEEKLVLIVEDDAAIRRLVQDVLGDVGVATATAADGADGLEQARARRPALIMLDLVLPGLDGIDLIRELRRDEHTAAIPIIAVSAGGPRDEQRARQAGCDDFLAKPFDVGDLEEKVLARLGRGSGARGQGPG